MESLTSPNRRVTKQTTDILEQDLDTYIREHHSKGSCWNATWHGILYWSGLSRGTEIIIYM